MSNQEILEAAITKAIDGGWTGVMPIYDDHMDQWCVPDGDGGYIVTSIIELVFNHDFAKALWHRKGEAKMYYHYPTRWKLFRDDELATTTALLTEWQYHLQQMVIADDPIAYLGENMGSN